MTQFQFEMICKIIESGAPALSNELCSSLNNLVVDRNQLAKEVEDLKAQLDKSTTDYSEKANPKDVKASK